MKVRHVKINKVTVISCILGVIAADIILNMPAVQNMRANAGL
jgi:hypothetical protein